jgi:predicted extracellular nuclease
MKSHYITWWNVENLFDKSTSTNRPVRLQKKLNKELKGWTSEIVQNKLQNIASIIQKINNGLGPDIIGLCEVENKAILQKFINTINLSNRDYEIVHQEMNDKRGIDIGFIYDKNEYNFTGPLFSYELVKRSATRDILQVEFKTRAGNQLLLIGNHWPARSAGKYLSEPYRMIAGETLSYYLTRIQEIRGKDTPVVVMGDFNDTPYDRSLTEYALSTSSRKKVVYGTNPYLYNLMWPLMGEEKASYYFGSDPLMLDQILLSKGIAKHNQTFSIKENPVKVESFPEMTKGRYQKPLRFGRPSKKKEFNKKGFSDHFPITLLLNEK